MNSITIKAFAKINLTLDVLGKLPNGFHQVEMIMQQISLHDEVFISYETFSRENFTNKDFSHEGFPREGFWDKGFPHEDFPREGFSNTENASLEENLHSFPWGNFIIELSTNSPDIPTDSGNLAYKAALLMLERFGKGFTNKTSLKDENLSAKGSCSENRSGSGDNPQKENRSGYGEAIRKQSDPGDEIRKESGHKDVMQKDPIYGKITININKTIPVAAGLAGGSSNCAAVIHGINKLWKLNLSLDELCRLGAELGSDVPFCVMGQAAANKVLKENFSEDSLCCHCALASGTGTKLEPLKGLETYVVLSKPPVSVSTAEVYKGIDSEEIISRPDNREMIAAIRENNYKVVYKNMINVLENFTLKRYPSVVYTKNKMSDLYKLGCSIMSGSGPSVFCLCQNAAEAERLCNEMLKINQESFWAQTTR